jgi:hypothetical protein
MIIALASTRLLPGNPFRNLAAPCVLSLLQLVLQRHQLRYFPTPDFFNKSASSQCIAKTNYSAAPKKQF